MNTYLNTTYYNTFDLETRTMIVESVYNVGLIDTSSSKSTISDISYVSATKWKGKLGLINISEYVRANSSDNCTSVSEYDDFSCRNNGNNWMSNNMSTTWATLSPPFSSSYTTGIWVISNTGSISTSFISVTHYIRPVVNISAEVQITGGDGSESNPFTLKL